MSQSAGSNGSRIIKALGVLTLIGIFVAVGRIVLKVFTEGDGEPDETQTGV